MPRDRLEERNLRSLARRSMLSIFRPLDPAERLPREEIPARDRGGLKLNGLNSGWAPERKLSRAELAAVVGIPALLVLGIALGASGASIPVVVVSIALLVLALAAFVLYGWRHRRDS